MEKQLEQTGEIVMYQPDETIRLEVRMEDETVWLTQAQMAELFQTSKNNVTLHIRNVYKEKELSPNPTSKESLLVRVESNRQVARKVKLYNLDVIISVGYRVKSQRGTEFRQWANRVIKNYLLRGYAINYQFRHKAHDRFLLIDDEVYHIGASIKDLGKKWFAFTLMHDIKASELIKKMS